MKRIFYYLTLGIIFIFLLTACGKQPTEEINQAKALVDSVMTEGAEKYTPEEAKKLNDSMQAAMDEVRVQDGKYFKDYSKAKDLLTKARTEADTLKTGLAAKKEEAKKNAETAREAANAAVEEAKQLLAKAPKGKGSQADIEALQSDMKGIEDTLPEVTSAMDSGDYNVAMEKSNALKEKATAISDQIKKAMEKAGTKKNTKKKKK